MLVNDLQFPELLNGCEATDASRRYRVMPKVEAVMKLKVTRFLEGEGLKVSQKSGKSITCTSNGQRMISRVEMI